MFTSEGDFRPITINLLSTWKSVYIDENGKGKIVFIDDGLCMWSVSEYVLILKIQRIIKYAGKKICS